MYSTHGPSEAFVGRLHFSDTAEVRLFSYSRTLKALNDLLCSLARYDLVAGTTYKGWVGSLRWLRPLRHTLLHILSMSTLVSVPVGSSMPLYLVQGLNYLPYFTSPHLILSLLCSLYQ
jgi:hypothetical protein